MNEVQEELGLDITMYQFLKYSYKQTVPDLFPFSLSPQAVICLAMHIVSVINNLKGRGAHSKEKNNKSGKELTLLSSILPT